MGEAILNHFPNLFQFDDNHINHVLIEQFIYRGNEILVFIVMTTLNL